VKPVARRAKPAGQEVVDVVVIGAGHSGLAMSHCLTARSIEHVVLERGEIANSWRHERWDSLRLLTPNWLTRLPGCRYSGDNPDGYMSVDEVVGFVTDYATIIDAPVLTGTRVTSITPLDAGYRVRTGNGDWRCRAAVIASGACNLPELPALSKAMPENIAQLTAHEYRNPGQLEPGGVLVVGASSTGLQLADELRRAGHEVFLSVGEHVRMPRLYRGRDIQWWMHACGLFDQRYDEVDDLVRARRVPSPQLVGSAERTTMDLNSLTATGVQIVGRLAGVRGGKAQFSGSLRNVCALADLKMNRLLATIDEWTEREGLAAEAGPVERFEPTRVPGQARLELALDSGELRTVLWATGYRPDYSWLQVPVLDRKGYVRHDGGAVDAPGLYLMGMPFLRRRKSSFIHGAEDDASELSGQLAAYLDTLPARSGTRMVV
jgi:putative flavoprotein involved in K+ transport